MECSMPKGNGQIKRLRLQMQLSQNRMASHVGIDSATYRRAENGRDNIAELTVERIAATFTSLLKKPISSASLIADEPESETADENASPTADEPESESADVGAAKQ
jgi:transcriptional regulator with XRE-family HTH domain